VIVGVLVGVTAGVSVRRPKVFDMLRAQMVAIEDTHRKLPPQSIEAEESVLGALSLVNRATPI